MPLTPAVLSQKMLLLFERGDLKAGYLQNQPAREQELNFSSFLFILSASLMVNASYSFIVDPANLAECHKQMLTWWGHNRIIRLRDFVKSPSEFTKVVELAKYQSDSSISGDHAETRISLYSLLSYSLLVRMKLYEKALLQAVTQVEDNGGFKVLALLTEHLITGQAIDSTQPTDPWARTFRELLLRGMLEKYLLEIEAIFSEP